MLAVLFYLFFSKKDISKQLTYPSFVNLFFGPLNLSVLQQQVVATLILV